MVSALNRIMQANKAPFSVFNKKDVRFCDLMLTMNFVSTELHKQGIGAQCKHVSVIEHEAMLWEQGKLGDSSPRVLQLTVFFCCGLQFCLRGIHKSGMT